MLRDYVLGGACLLQALHFHRTLRRLACEHKEARMASADFSTVEICGVLVC